NEVTVNVRHANVNMIGLKEHLDKYYGDLALEIDPDAEDDGMGPMKAREKEYTEDELKDYLYDKFHYCQYDVKNAFKPLLSILYIINQSEVENKEKYNKILDSQVTETEKYILFYFYALYHPPMWSEIENFIILEFLNRIDPNTLIQAQHNTWLYHPAYKPKVN